MKEFDVDKKGREPESKQSGKGKETTLKGAGKGGGAMLPPTLGARPMPWLVLAEKLMQAELASVKLEQQPELTEQGKQACAIEGQRIGVARPEVADNARIMAHEAAHLVQQRGGAHLEAKADGAPAKDDRNASASVGPMQAAESEGAGTGAAEPEASSSGQQVESAKPGAGAQGAPPKAADFEAEADAAAQVFMGYPVPAEGLVLSAAAQGVMYQDEPPAEDAELASNDSTSDTEAKYSEQRQPGPNACAAGSGPSEVCELTKLFEERTTAQALDELRRQSPLSAGTLQTAKLELRQALPAGSNELWLAEKIAEHGPEPLWTKDLLEERFRRLHDYQAAAELAPELAGSLLLQANAAFEQQGVAGVVSLLRSQQRSIVVTVATQEMILDLLAADTAARWYAETFFINGPEETWNEDLQAKWAGLRNTQSYSENGARGELLQGQTDGTDWAIEAYYFQGRTSERALVIAGVHGREQGSIQLCEMLIADLKAASTLPYYSVIVVPILFPQNACKCPQPDQKKQNTTHQLKCDREMPDAKGRRDEGQEVNRNFPEEFTSLGKTPKNDAGEPLDANGAVILPENVALLKLIERFAPSRIMSMHGNNDSGTGFTIDKRVPNEKSTVKRDQARLDRLEQDPDKGQYEAQDQQDHELAVAMGKKTREEGEAKELERTDELTTINDKGGSGFSTNDTKADEGVSLGRYASAAGMTIVTLEIKGGDRAVEKEAGNARTKELIAYNEAIKTLFLGMTP